MELLPEAVNPTVEGMDDHGWSNSPEAKHAPADVYPEVADPEPVEPGFSNAKAVRADDGEAAAPKGKTEAKVITASDTEDKSVKPAKKAAAKK